MGKMSRKNSELELATLDLDPLDYAGATCRSILVKLTVGVGLLYWNLCRAAPLVFEEPGMWLMSMMILFQGSSKTLPPYFSAHPQSM